MGPPLKKKQRTKPIEQIPFRCKWGQLRLLVVALNSVYLQKFHASQLTPLFPISSLPLPVPPSPPDADRCLHVEKCRHPHIHNYMDCGNSSTCMEPGCFPVLVHVSAVQTVPTAPVLGKPVPPEQAKLQLPLQLPLVSSSPPWLHDVVAVVLVVDDDVVAPLLLSPASSFLPQSPRCSADKNE